MSTQLARQEMHRFLADTRPGVLSVSGRWGVGKTFGWRQALQEMRQNGNFPRERYAYVSVFGLRNIDALKAAIFQSTVKLDSTEVQPSIASFRELVNSATNYAEAGSRKGLNAIVTGISALPWVGKASELILPGAALLIRNQLICIDDLERAGSGLDLADILGFVSSLREEKDCKVVLLLNEEGFNEARDKDFRTHLEKVVDQAVRYTPTPEEAAGTALDISNPLDKLLAQRTKILGITNIRVIKRIRSFLSFIEADLAQLHPVVMEETVAGLALLGWAVFEPMLAPPLDSIRQRNEYSAYFPKEETSPEEAECNALLDRYGFTHMSEFDDVILAGLTAGGFDLEAVRREAAVLHEAAGKADVHQALRRPWEILEGGFGDDESSFKAALIESIENHGSDLGVGQVDGIVKHLRELDADDEADGLIKVFVEANAGKSRGFFDIKQHHLSEAPDVNLAKALEDKLSGLTLDHDPKSILAKIDEDGSWGPSDTDFLASMSEKDYVHLLQSLKGKELSAVVRIGLRFSRLEGDDPACSIIGDKMLAALEELGKRSRLNAIRVRPYLPRKRQPNAPSDVDSNG
ncbi:hypothetical protein E5A73_04635 [Sphingomonas gei]|uniref:KAP NTPase domain-containing protein n=1 Tax=Sphingomonas gei TaxID=1395960 RepID=A0A4S1XFS6_9SPHN|nr:hypothetical protein [Sphingomonas gei]TGX54747.1 hypothetical protein E5A73_04635 [Sphingomonas gei]